MPDEVPLEKHSQNCYLRSLRAAIHTAKIAAIVGVERSAWDGAIITVMISRDELKSLIDRIPEERLGAVQSILNSHINPPPANPQTEHMRERTQQYRKFVEQRYRETRKPGTMPSMLSGGITGMHKGTPFGRHGFHYWDEDVLVQQSLQSFNGQEIEIMERLSMAADGRKLICNLEVSTAGITLQHSDEFPISLTEGKRQ